MSILIEIVERTRADLAETKEAVPLAALQCAVADAPSPPSFVEALRRREDGCPRIIAELKKASPSKGVIRPDFEPLALARELARNGAAALSVLTEPHYFQGSPAYLQGVAREVRIPLLRKDFIVDPYQIYEARAWGASAVLLIAAALDPGEFAALQVVAGQLGLAVLAEVHNDRELDMVLETAPEVVGVNSRDLKTFKTDLGTVARLMGHIPKEIVKVAESGIHGPADIRAMVDAGADAFLIGETIMRETSPGAKLRELLGA